MAFFYLKIMIEETIEKEEEKYTDDDIISEIKSIFPKYRTRKRKYVDQRNYLLCILYYKFYYTEYMLRDIFKGTEHELDRSTINYAKKQTITLAKVKDELFVNNIALLYSKFPFDIPETANLGTRSVKSHIVRLDLKTLGRIFYFANINDLCTHKAINYLLNKSLDSLKTSKLEDNG